MINHLWQRLTNKKTEPIIELLNSLELSGEVRRQARDLPTEVADCNYNMEIDSRLKTTNEAVVAAKNEESIDDFVDDFVNGYLSSGVTVSQLASKLNSSIEGLYTPVCPLFFVQS